MYFLQRRPTRIGLGTDVRLATIGELRGKLKTRLDKLRLYDLFLRDRTVTEWLKDNTIIANWLVRTSASRQLHEESHAFWSLLSDAEKRNLVSRWMRLVETGTKLAGDARQGGIGVGYGGTETAPPARAQTVNSWVTDADRFMADFEKLRQDKRVESRIEDSNPITKVLKDTLAPIAWTLGLGVAGVMAFNFLTRPRN